MIIPPDPCTGKQSFWTSKPTEGDLNTAKIHLNNMCKQKDNKIGKTKTKRLNLEYRAKFPTVTKLVYSEFKIIFNSIVCSEVIVQR